MNKRQSLDELRKELRLLKGWVEANTRRIEELEATAFQLEDCEEVVLLTVPRRPDGEGRSGPPISKDYTARRPSRSV